MPVHGQAERAARGVGEVVLARRGDERACVGMAVILLVFTAAILVTAVVTYVTLRLGARALAVLGQTGIRVLTRIMGLLTAIATQFILTGISEGLHL